MDNILIKNQPVLDYTVEILDYANSVKLLQMYSNNIPTYYLQQLNEKRIRDFLIWYFKTLTIDKLYSTITNSYLFINPVSIESILEQFKALKCIEVSFDSNGELPMSLDVFENLTELKVNGKTTKFPEVVYRFPKLKKISFNYSVVRKFHSRLWEIETLEELCEHHHVGSDSEDD